MIRAAQNCGNCANFRIYQKGPIGSCRANPPVVIQGLQQSVAHAQPVPVLQGVWPPTSEAEWCGAWKNVIDFDLEEIMHKDN